jgi:LmbE family N-acetylglucosaminyl deacetylase
MSPTLLAVFPHPDDESACSGTLALAADRGWRVVIAVATRGEAGEIADPSLATPDNLGAVREAEMRAACKVLGIEDVRFLGYRDSGMAGTPENELPTSLHRADPERVTGQLVGLIRELRPQIVLTFEPFGIYGHPDHIAVSRYTTQAFHLAADPTAFSETGEPWQPHGLYYCAFPLAWFNQILERMRALNLETSGLEQINAQIKDNAEKVADQITHEIDVSAYVDAKVASLACHRTQLTPHAPFYHLLKPQMVDLMAREYLIQAWPEEIKASIF